MALHDLIVLDDAALAALAMRADVTAAFPALFGPYLRAKQACGRCQKRRITPELYNTIKVAIRSLGQADKHRLLDLLDARQIQLEIRTGGGLVRQTISR